MKKIIWASLCLLLTTFSLSVVAQPTQFISMPSDLYIPNIGHSTYADDIISSVQNGTWTDPDTWGGIVPTDSNTVIIAHEVNIDSTGIEVFDIAIYPDGHLSFPTDLSIQLYVGTIQVHLGGTLEIGTESNPINEEVLTEIIFLDRAIDLDKDPGQYTNGLIVFGTLKVHGHSIGSSFLRLTEEPIAGDNTLSLTLNSNSWKIDDRIKLPDTRQLKSSFNDDTRLWEERLITAISSDSLTLTLDTALDYDHKGAHDVNGLRYLPHAMNMTRNVVFRSENPEGNRGHTLFAMRSDIDVRYASFIDLGRTINTTLDNTEWDENGVVTHIGTNQVARYPIHTHHLFGPANIPANGYQYTLIGNVVDGGESDHNFKWGITIHGSHYGLIENNVVYNVKGSGIVTEDGSESFNVFDNNMVVRVDGQGNIDTHDRGDAGSGLWFRGPNNYCRNNVAANTEAAAYSMNAYRLGKEERMIPAFQGAITMENGIALNAEQLPILEFKDNEGYGVIQIGFDIWEVGGTGNNIVDVPETTIENFQLWHVSRRGIHIYRSHRLTFDGYVNIGDSVNVTKYMTVRGMTNDSQYPTRQIIIRNSDIQNLAYGILTPPGNMIPNHISTESMASLDSSSYAMLAEGQPGEFLIENTFLRNWHNILIENPKDVSFSGPRKTIIRNVDFEEGHGSNRSYPQSHIGLSPSTFKANLTTKDEIVVEDYDQIPDLDFRVFYKEQHADAILPETDDNDHVIGAPVPNLTNSQASEIYCLAFAGAIAPCYDDTTYPKIKGYVCDVESYDPLLLQDTVTSIICLGDSLFLEGDFQDQPGVYFDFFTTPQSCPVQKWTKLVVESPCMWSGGNRVYVDKNASGIKNGYDWQNAFTKLSEALDVAQSFDHITEIWVAEGMYYPTIIGDRSLSFTLRNSLKVYGGFVGTETNLNQRPTDGYSTLTGDLGVSIDLTHNSYHVVSIDASCTDCLLDGFHIEDGNANGSIIEHQKGAGITSKGTLTINNTTISKQHSILNADDIYQIGPSAQLIIGNVIIKE